MRDSVDSVISCVVAVVAVVYGIVMMVVVTCGDGCRVTGIPVVETSEVTVVGGGVVSVCVVLLLAVMWV